MHQQAPSYREAPTYQGTPLLAEPEEQPLLAPVTPDLTWSWVHSLTQRPLRPSHLPATGEAADGADAEPVTVLRRTATIRRGTRMIKLLGGQQLGAYLYGRLPHGFCYRAYDLAHLRSGPDLALLTGDGSAPADVVFGLRWRAVDPADYDIPFSLTVGTLPAYPGLPDIRPHDRLGPAVLGTGFAPSQHHVVPEFVTTDFADLPLTANASLVAFTPDGQEITLYTYLPEQRAWTRMFGPAWRHLLHGLPELPPDQEYLPVKVGDRASTLMGTYRGAVYEAIADPPHEYRVNARARAARYPIETLVRRTCYATWRGVAVTVVRADGDWLRLRLCRPDRDSTPTLAAQPLERGVYESWANITDVTDLRTVEFPYHLPAPSGVDHGLREIK